MQTLVISQAPPALEGLRADGTNERLLQRAADVPLKGLLPGEALLAQRARVGDRLPRVVPTHVPVEGRLVRELRPALGAFVKLLPGVLPRMRDEPAEPGETFAALGAKVRLGVRQAVPVHQALQSKRFATSGTLEVLGELLFPDFHCGLQMLAAGDRIYLS